MTTYEWGNTIRKQVSVWRCSEASGQLSKRFKDNKDDKGRWRMRQWRTRWKLLLVAKWSHQTCKHDEKHLRWVFLIWQFRRGDEEGFVDSTSASIFLALTIWTLWGPKKRKRKDARRRGRTKLMQWVWIEGMVGPSNGWRWKRKSSVDGEELNGPTIFVALLVGFWNLNGYQKTGFDYGGLVAPPIGKYRLVRLGNRFCERCRSDRRWGSKSVFDGAVKQVANCPKDLRTVQDDKGRGRERQWRTR